ncbi:hypothetical protein D8674_013682 [Pyrus ussuriensis x Pyrus communis]|uniref:Acetyltransferase n=1 Tax=Pyrus ussuriensis x Pyrus communis TaxID=2448454 RepID=A0A5N5GT17_9ROSA|nr:uncharacterized acetyltransferase At3g50280-like [Pyrus x bretschneideri]KAB2617813.1 hypothetical protein D8674_013682 [Pyrus ussuriensis x Pyrus communis]
MRHIRLISTTTVQPTTHSDELTRRIELTPWDLQFLLVDQVQKGLLFHKPTSTNCGNEDLKNNLVEHLKSSFATALDIFYPLAGRLAITENKDDNTTSFAVECNGAGAEFVHAVADGVTVADILDPVLVPDEIVYDLFSMNGALNYESVTKPLLAAQVTELVDGVFIGCTMNHLVIDGSTFWHFFNTWSEISRGGGGRDGISQSPRIFGREFLDGIIDLPVRIPFFRSQIPDKFLPPPLKQRVFHFPKEKIAQLKAKANDEMGTTKISSLQALLAHLWVSITRTRHLNPDQEIKYCLLVGLRQRLQPPLPDEYLGNAVLFGTATSTVSDLLNRGLGWVALEMNKMIASKTKEDAINFLKQWIESPKLAKLNAFASDDALSTGSSPRFNVYGNNFGWGSPLAVRSGAGNKFDGKLTVFPGAEDGSIDFEACLSPQTLHALAEDEEFMASVACSGN